VANVTAVIFDFYETLVQLDHDMRERAFDEVARAAGAELPPGEAYRHWRELTPDWSLSHQRPPLDGPAPVFRSFQDFWLERSRDLFRRWRVDAPPELGAEAYARAHAQAEVYPDAAGTIDALRGRCSLAVLSDADTGFLVDCLAHNRLAFDVVVSSEDVGAYKPHVAMFREVCARLDVAPAQAVYVGDSPWADIAGARNAGLRAVWLNRHARPWPGDIEPPETVITSLAELASVLG